MLTTENARQTPRPESSSPSPKPPDQGPRRPNRPTKPSTDIMKLVRRIPAVVVAAAFAIRHPGSTPLRRTF